MTDAHKTDFGFDLDGTLSWLQRYCARRSGEPSVAEDLAQETLFEAWRNRHKLRDHANERGWLAGVANNVCLRWRRSAARGEWLKCTFADDLHGDADSRSRGQPLASTISDEDDPVWISERRELRGVIEQALREVPEDTRQLLLERYETGLTTAEIAERHQLTAAHAAVRLQRARTRLRDVLLESRQEDLAEFGIGVDHGPGWRPTRLWCPSCGTTKLRSQLEPAAGRFRLQCPRCAVGPENVIYNWEVDGSDSPGVLGSARSVSQALSRTLGTNPLFLPLPDTGLLPACSHCGGRPRPEMVPDPDRPDDVSWISIEVWCDRCGYLGASATFGGLGVWSEDGYRFWRDHGQVTTRVEPCWFGDRTEAVAVTLTSVAGSDTLTAVFAAQNARPLLLDGGSHRTPLI